MSQPFDPIDLRPYLECAERDIRELAALIADERRALAAAEEPPPRRPHWMPEQVWLGVEVGRWPIRAFGTRDEAARWAAQGKQDTPIASGDRRRIFPVAIPADTQAFESESIPSSTRLRRAGS